MAAAKEFELQTKTHYGGYSRVTPAAAKAYSTSLKRVGSTASVYPIVFVPMLTNRLLKAISILTQDARAVCPVRSLRPNHAATPARTHGKFHPRVALQARIVQRAGITKKRLVKHPSGDCPSRRSSAPQRERACIATTPNELCYTTVADAEVEYVSDARRAPIHRVDPTGHLAQFALLEEPLLVKPLLQ